MDAYLQEQRLYFQHVSVDKPSKWRRRFLKRWARRWTNRKLNSQTCVPRR